MDHLPRGDDESWAVKEVRKCQQPFSASRGALSANCDGYDAICLELLRF